MLNKEEVNREGCQRGIVYPLPLSLFVKIIIKLHLPGKSRLIFNYKSILHRKCGNGPQSLHEYPSHCVSLGVIAGILMPNYLVLSM